MTELESQKGYQETFQCIGVDELMIVIVIDGDMIKIVQCGSHYRDK